MIQAIKLNKVMQMTTLSKASIYRGVADGTFPAQIRLGKRAVAWRLDEVEEWLQQGGCVGASEGANNAASPQSQQSCEIQHNRWRRRSPSLVGISQFLKGAGGNAYA